MSAKKPTKKNATKAVVFGPLQYAATKFAVAVSMMAVSELPMRERIHEAYREFAPAMFFAKGMPERLGAGLKALVARMSWAENKDGRGTLPATLALISDVECRRIARMITDLSCDLESALARAYQDEAVERAVRDERARVRAKAKRGAN